MLPDIDFEEQRHDDVPISTKWGLETFKEHFAMRARTQLRPDVDMVNADFRVYANDGFAMEIREVGEVGVDGDKLLSHPSLVAELAHPQSTPCKPFDKVGVTLRKGKVYTIDVKYWQGQRSKCLKVCCLHHDHCCIQLATVA